MIVCYFSFLKPFITYIAFITVHPEEALYLFERGQLSIEYDGEQMLGSKTYETLVSYITINSYLAYAKLKVSKLVIFNLYHDIFSPNSFKLIIHM